MVGAVLFKNIIIFLIILIAMGKVNVILIFYST